MKKRRVVDVVRDLAEPICAQAEVELIDVEFVKEGPFRYLRLTIDKEEGVSLDDCSEVSRALNSKLDKVDPIEEQYFLEVTSPGVERELKRPEDFERNIGKLVQAKLYTPLDGLKLIKGTLKSYSDGLLTIEMGARLVELSKEKISSIRLVGKFDGLDEIGGE
ncbi:ribosome maturation factor RimP [Acidaminobacter hydrogenoformans]|uniref:Ribosome maturation factor RimP n=1 Tax=Acidaminobacter hydrogenoformans DSM 2784 TaxID=1120920 RepID=A0A1G5RS72_9FIRM|nr:ribosome maturation factor RimP [Acidaminobacter hydrogenoformans]SCZ76857.1 ribosome maturation factor RimP [Acidaminobacter hydrogenoformans DSM 2784]